MKKQITAIIMGSLLLAAASCKKFLELKPIDSPTEETFYVDANGLQGGLVACYDALQGDALYGYNMLTLAENRGDNIEDRNPGANAGVRYEIESFAETPANVTLSDTWLAAYRTIYRCNQVIARAPAINMDSTIKLQVTGQALFIRALMYFNLVRMWGYVPLITQPQTSSEARNNQRSDSAALYAQIIADLTTAKAGLPLTWPDAQRGRVTAYAASALLGKVYLYQKQYSQVIAVLQPLATAIYTGTSLAMVPQTTTFPNGLKTSKDIIFSVQYLLGGIGEFAHQNNRYRNNDNANVITLPQTEFETGDNRKALVAPVGNGIRPGKFNAPQVNNETSSDFPVLRCAEVLLMYAEALNAANTFPDAEAFKALNAVRTNAGIAAKTTAQITTQADFKTALYKERRLELALECDRWFDINRLGLVSTIYPVVPAYRKWYPVPQTEIDNITNKTGWQNNGY